MFEKRGELRRLAATQNKRLNSSASSKDEPKKLQTEIEVPRCLARDFSFWAVRTPLAC